MNYTADELAQLEHQLAERQNDLLQQVAEEVDMTGEGRNRDLLGGEPGDDADRAVSVNNVDFNLITANRHVQEIRDIEAARQRMQEGTYGRCVQCGGEIPYQRLLAQPTALRCFACQDQYERTHAAAETPTL